MSVSISYSQESLFPQIPGWNIAQEDPVYDANNLWDIIDGAADLYLEYAFVDLHIARYINSDSIEVKTELYRHRSDVDAFGIYSQERDTGYNFIPLGVQGYLQQGVLNFLTGSCYVKLSTYQTGTRAQEAMRTVGTMLAEHLRQNNAMPRLFQVFPVKGKLPNTEQYVARNFLGYSFLNTAYTVMYKDGSAFKVFVIESTAPEKSESILANYFKAIPKEAVAKFEREKYVVQDPHNGLIELQVFNRYICGVIGCTDSETRDLCFQELGATLTR